MTEFNVAILGCGSAKPSLRHNTSSQMISYKDACYMLDCGEGTQVQLMKYKLHTGKLEHIFISHSHGDHCLGLIGLLSSLSLNNRYSDIHLHIPADLEPILRRQIEFFVNHADFDIHIHPISCVKPTLIFEDEHFKVNAFPLDHRVPCYGFLFQEREQVRHIRPECIRQYHIPHDRIDSIKQGADFLTSDGHWIPNAELTLPPSPARRYAYFTDTRPMTPYADQLHDINLLYHDATYGDEKDLAVKYFHSTAIEAAEFAKQCCARKLILGHYSTRYDKMEEHLLECAVEVFPETMLADEGLKVSVV